VVEEIDFNSIEPDKLLEFLKILYKDPIFFSKYILHIEPDSQQAEVIRSVYSFPTKKVAVKAGRGSGKTWAASILIFHFLCTRSHSQVYLTAATGGTLHGAIWPTLSKIYDGMNPYYKNIFDFQNSAIRHKESPNSWFCMLKTSRAENPDSLAGSHAKNMLFVADESSGIPEENFKIIQGSLTEENNYLLMLSNPRRLSGFFYNAFLPANKTVYKQITMTCIDSEWVKQEHVNDMKKLYGEGSDEWRVEVLGEFPKTETSSIITPEMVDEAVTRKLEWKDADGDIIWGIDVGAGKNKSVVVGRKGRLVYLVKKYPYRDSMEVVGEIKRLFDKTPEEDRPIALHVDSVGWGAGAYYRMKELGLPVIKADAGMKAVQKRYIFNNKAEWSWQMRKWFLEDEPVIAPEAQDNELIQQLPLVCQRISSDNRFSVEKKEDFAKRWPKIGSPDFYDALAMTFNLHGRKIVGLIT